MCCIHFSQSAYAKQTLLGKREIVIASYYGGHDGFEGRTTASCTVFNASELTVAHKTLPLGTKVVLKNPKTGVSKLVTITDRGPYTKGRDIDVAKYGVGKPLDVANNTPLEMKIVYVPKEPIMGNACKQVKSCNKQAKKRR
jgi:rare lipoprotein A